MSVQEQSFFWLSRLEELERRLDAFVDNDDDDETDQGGVLVQILRDACALVREAEASGTSDFKLIVDKAHYIINKGVLLAYGDADLFDFMPPFAYDDTAPLVSDSLKMPFSQGMIDVMIPFVRDIIGTMGAPATMPPIPGPGPWNKFSQPHANTTRLARFRPGVGMSATDATPSANVIYHARCEITNDRIFSPSAIAMSSGGSCLAVAAAGGWKNRDPVIHVYPVDDGADGDFLSEGLSIDPGLSEVAHQLTLDEERKLIFVSDSYRIKSFSWSLPSGRRKSANAVHTLRCDKYNGGIAILPNGRIVRAGHGEAVVWNIDDLETHGPGKKHIGSDKFNTEDSWRDNDGGDIELSTGSNPHTTIKLADSEFSPQVWHLHKPTGHMLSGESGRRSRSYACVSLDLEHGGQTIARYLGHGGDVESFSTSEGDPNVFATAGSDGFVRLFDVRHPLPTITFDHGKRQESCPDVVLVHPDGIPTIFSAGQSSQQIKMWDVRARATIYELATGNNAVVSMTWDSRHSTLYAATECEYMDRLGHTHDYRQAKIPRWAEDHPDIQGDEVVDQDMAGDDEDYEDEDDDGFDEDEERCWPSKAYHGEQFFGYCFDAGDHRLFRYAFKADANPRQLPAYGNATMGDTYW
ncbi:hypothetical protein AcW1_008183 [Taiwanofungus camphoratus]|nr:hypothetical protein AcV5_008479 [Antrodia cinnamomea]KAI0951032.1 hypothetical protein AcW1_008183 [Antrodia cinnamomea]KAI0955933.1 hypothetical protein AcV7_006470 [Antrodia cinnamomea]